MKISDLKKDKRWKLLPKFIKSHEVFNSITKIEKPFEEIGLPNSLEKCKLLFNDRPTHIGFTADGADGFWNIATMSMRGVMSCMNWKSSFSHLLVKHVTDPFLGIVFITDNIKLKYGISFRYRALVRYAYNIKEGRPCLFIERPYKDTGNKNYNVHDNASETYILKLFKVFLRKKIKNKMRIYTGFRSGIVVPSSTSYCKLYGKALVSGDDSGIFRMKIKSEFVNKFIRQ